MNDSDISESARGSQTLARGLRILTALRDEPDGLLVADIARVLGLHRSVVTRLLVTLEDERYVERTPSRAYRLGPELVSLARVVRSDLRDVATTVLRELAEHVGATAVLVVRDVDHAVVVNVVEPMHSDLRLLFRLGSRHLLDQGAEGMAILAGNPPLSGERAEIAAARLAGYAVSTGEIMPGTWGLAVPVVRAGRCDMSIGVIAASALNEATTSAFALKASATLAGQLSSTDELA